MPATEQEAEDCTRITWEPTDRAARLHLYPAAGGAIQSLVAHAFSSPR
jgi:hypothetical protein